MMFNTSASDERTKDIEDFTKLFSIPKDMDLNTIIGLNSFRPIADTPLEISSSLKTLKIEETKGTEPHILDEIKKLWRLEMTPSISFPYLNHYPITNAFGQNSYVGSGIASNLQKSFDKTYSPWNFMDYIPLSKIIMKRSFPERDFNGGQTSSNVQETPLSTVPTYSEKVQKVPQNTCTAADIYTPKEEIVDTLNFIVYSVEAIHRVGWEAMFFIQEKHNKPGQDLIKSGVVNIKIELTRPSGSVEQLVLYPDFNLSYPGRYFCSFCPAGSGPHFLSISASVNAMSNYRSILGPTDLGYRHIQGSPLYIDPVCSFPNYIGNGAQRFGFSTPVISCTKAWGVSVYRPNNWIYMTDRESSQILILDPSPKVITKFGSKGSNPGQLFRPTGIAVDHVYKRVLVTDKDNHRISIFDLEGKFITMFGRHGHENGEFDFPWGIAVSPNGQLIVVADSRNYRLQMFDANGTFLRKFSVFETNPFRFKAEFYHPRGITFSLDGNQIYVADFNLHSVFVFDLNLTRKETFISQGHLKRPQGLAVDEGGNLIIADSKNNCIRVVSPTGTLIGSLNGSEDNPIENPLDVAVLTGGRLVIVDKDNRMCIFEFSHYLK